MEKWPHSNTITFPTGPLPKGYMTDNRGHIVIAVGSTFIVLETFAFALRTVSRRMIKVPYGWDDAIVVPALILNLLVCALCIVGVPYGGAGRHTLAVVKEDPNTLSFLGKDALLAMPIAYHLAVAFSKFAILNIYLRIFRVGSTRKATYAVAVVIALHTIVTIFVVIFQCKPISGIWTVNPQESCLNMQELFVYTSIPNIVTDLVMLVIPLPEVWRLHTSTRMKIGVTVTLLTASVGIVTSILRFVVYIKSHIFADPAWEAVKGMSYSIAEPGTYFIAACLPSYRPLVRQINGSVTSFITKRYDSRQRLGSASGPNNSEERYDDVERKQPTKPVRGFDSVLLSDISSTKSVFDREA